MFEISTTHHLTPIGWLTLTANHAGITKIEFGKHGECRGESTILRQAIRELNEYFTGERREFSVPVSLSGTPFQRRVWDALQKIP